LFSASPSADTSDRRLDFLVAECRRVLAHFLVEYPELADDMKDRTLTVRMIRSYGDRQADYVRQIRLADTSVQQAVAAARRGAF